MDQLLAFFLTVQVIFGCFSKTQDVVYLTGIMRNKMRLLLPLMLGSATALDVLWLGKNIL
jgi:hypothetical protein